MDATRVQSQRPVLEIKTTNAQMQITHSKPRLRIKQQRPTMKVDRENPTFKISRENVRRQVRRRLGGNVSPEFRRRAELRTYNALKQMSGLSGKKNELAKMSALEQNMASIELAQIEKAQYETPLEETMHAAEMDSPQIEWNEGHLSIEWSDYVLEIDWEDIGMPQIDVEPYSVEVSIRNQPVIRLRMNPRKVNDGVGKQIDEKV